MRRNSDIIERCIDLTLEIVDICKTLKKHHQYEFASQVVRSASSMGANLTEAQVARTKIEFGSINSIALREARETIYWLVVIGRLKIIPVERIDKLRRETSEIANIIAAIVISSKRSKGRGKEIINSH